ncbi:MAG: GNAT family N-acetyltransferase [Clostridium sp.]
MIKLIDLNDIKEISELFIDSFNNSSWNDKWTYETASKRLSDIINMPGFIGMEYYHENELAGIILGRSEQYYDGMHFQILEFCISSKFKGKGYGTILLNKYIEKLREENIKRVFLMTLHGDSTEGFYKKNGFETDENMIIMSKKI